MFSPCKYLFMCVIPVLYYLKSCVSEPVFPPSLVLYSPGDPEYTDVIVKREHDNLTLVCELRGDPTPRMYVWNHVSNSTQRPYSVDPAGPAPSSQLMRVDLQLEDSGYYMCSAPPSSLTKYILVQTKGPSQCARGAFWCGARCVLAAYVCDGRRDCARGEDEAPALCGDAVCSRGDKLNCSSGRCLSSAACCRGAAPLCRQPACCDEFPLTRQLGYVEEYPPLFEDRRAPDDYGFIQSTIYTVTACALIFMIAVVLLVSAICKMHMKRAALRGYSHADRAARHHYSVQYSQAHRFPPCYEASRLLEENRTGSPPLSPARAPVTPDVQCVESPNEPRGLARLSSIFSSRYRQVPTQPEPVEMTSLGRVAGGAVPPYRSPTCCALDADLLFPDERELSYATGRELNYPVDNVRRRPRRNTLERVIDQLDRQRLTLQLGRFQLSIPRAGRGGGATAGAGPRPDTPTVELEELALRLRAGDTYTLNGRTIRLLGASFQGCPRPPPYKPRGPPPRYLSRETLHPDCASSDPTGCADREAAANVEMPPCYEDLDGNFNGGNEFNITGYNFNGNCNGNDLNSNGSDLNCNGDGNGVNATTVDANARETGSIERAVGSERTNDIASESKNTVGIEASVENNDRVETLSSIIDNLPAIDDMNANETDISNGLNNSYCDNVANNNVICD